MNHMALQSGIANGLPWDTRDSEEWNIKNLSGFSREAERSEIVVGVSRRDEAVISYTVLWQG